jgi:hypothetical protein
VHRELIQLSGDSPGPEIQLFAKPLSGAKKPTHLLVETSSPPKSNLVIVDQVWAIPDWMSDGDVTPLSLLKTVCSRCGLRFRIGKREGRLIMSETVPGVFPAGRDPTPQEVAAVVQLLERPGKRGVLQTFLVNPGSDGSLAVALARALDLDRIQHRLPRFL